MTGFRSFKHFSRKEIGGMIFIKQLEEFKKKNVMDIIYYRILHYLYIIITESGVLREFKVVNKRQLSHWHLGV